MATVSQRGGLLGVVLRRVTTIIGVLFLVVLLTLFASLVVVVSHCSRVVRLVVGRIVGLVATVRQWLDWVGWWEYWGSVGEEVSGLPWLTHKVKAGFGTTGLSLYHHHCLGAVKRQRDITSYKTS